MVRPLTSTVDKVPNIQEKTTGRPGAEQVVLTTFIAFVVSGLANAPIGKSKTKQEAFLKGLLANNLINWGVLFVILVMASDFEASATLAIAFAWLILIATLLSKGEKAFQNLQKFQGQIQGASGDSPPQEPATT